MRFLSITLFILLLCPPANADQFNMGTRHITAEVANTEIPIRVFYPTLEDAVETKFGPWEILAAKNAKPAAGPFPLIAISHGLGGRYWNHHLLARQLVKAGFVVAAVQHPDDFMRIGHPELAILRPSELSAAIDTVLNDNRFGPSIDSQNIGAFGFSLGGFSTLAAAGGRIDFDKIAVHCADAKKDPEFCTGEAGGEPLPLTLRAKRWFYSLPKVDLAQDVYDPRLSAIVIAAPVGLPFDDMSRVQMPLLLLRAGGDQSLRHPFHAENIHGLLAVDHRYEVIEDLHHYAFLSPFPDSIAAGVGEPAQDPDGFDRAEFLEKTNQTITQFFTQHLTP